jgi:hypothetical protein
MPISVPVEKLVAVVICAAVAAPSSSPLRDASRLSGLRVRHAVPTTAVSAARYRALYSHGQSGALTAALRRFEPAPPSAASGTSRAWYDVRTHRLFVQRMPRPGRRALIHEYVRALIDQNFHLARIAQWRARDRDHWEAAEAMVDGVASLSSGLPTPGRTLAAQLRYLGGRAALTSALRTFPQTTEQLLHVDKFLERERALPVRLPARAGGASLVASETFGELDVRNLLNAFAIPGADADAEGWGGGRLAVYGDVAVIVLRWDDTEDAAKWQAAVPRYASAAFVGTPARTCPPLDACWGDLAAGVYGTTAVLALGPGSAAVAADLLQQD